MPTTVANASLQILNSFIESVSIINIDKNVKLKLLKSAKSQN